MTVAISQSNYIPWKGYFDLIAKADVFVFYDDMQYTKRDWRNRNKIKTANGLIWLSIPVEVKGKYKQKINETRVVSNDWVSKHLKSFELNYKKSEFFDEIYPMLTSWYAQVGATEYLSEINQYLTRKICDYLGIQTRLVDSCDYAIKGQKTDAILSVLSQIEGAQSYLSGPAASNYLDTTKFQQKNIDIEWMSYAGYPAYEQLYPPFEHGVTIIDLLFHKAQDAGNYMKYPPTTNADA